MGLAGRLRELLGLSPEESLLPVLEPPGWDPAGFLCRRWIPGLDDRYVPWIAFGEGSPRNPALVTEASAAARGLTLPEVERRAIANLASRPFRWRREWVRLEGAGELALLFGPVDDCAAEQALSRPFLEELHDILQSPTLALGVPRRGLIVATDGDADGRLLARFAETVRDHFARLGPPPISPALFAARGGEVVGLFDAAAPPGHRVREPASAPPVPRPAEPVEIATALLPDGELDGLRIVVASESLEAALEALRAAIPAAVREHAFNPAFGGIVRGHLDPVPEGASAGRLELLQADLAGALSGVSLASGRPVALSLTLEPPDHATRRTRVDAPEAEPTAAPLPPSPPPEHRTGELSHRFARLEPLPSPAPPPPPPAPRGRTLALARPVPIALHGASARQRRIRPPGFSLDELHVAVRAGSFASALAAFREAIPATVYEHAPDPAFGGRVVGWLDAATPDASLPALERLARELTTSLGARFTLASKSAIAVSFRIGRPEDDEALTLR